MPDALMDDFPALLIEKQAYESEIVKVADGGPALRKYLELLGTLNRRATGIVSFRWPTVAYPLYFRAGTSDLWNFQQIFVNKEYGFDMPFSPARILDLGAYVGYAAVFFAERFPHSEIFSVEPSPDNFRMLSLNTGAYANIRRINAAVWASNSRLSMNSFEGGDWGANLAEAETDGDRMIGDIQALSLSDIYDKAGWDSVDFLKCDIEGAEKKVFEACREFISGSVDICAVEIHDIAVPGAHKAVAACFDNGEFEVESSGEFDTFIRKTPKFGGKTASCVHVLSPATGLREIRFQNVGTQGWAYYIFDGSSCQLHPTNTHESPAEVSLTVELNGQTRFESGLSLSNPQGLAVQFSASLTEEGSDQEMPLDSISVPAGKTCRMEVATRPLFGRFRVSLRTRMAPGMATNHQALANWLDPQFR